MTPGQQEPGAPGTVVRQHVGTTQLLGALARVYDATLQPDSWPRILQALDSILGSDKGLFIRIDRNYPSASVTLTSGIPPHIDSAIKNRNLDDDRVWRAVLPMSVGSVFRVTELIPRESYTTGRLYQSIGHPGGLEYGLGAILENTPQFFSSVYLMRSTADFETADKELLRMLIPHLQSALRIGHRIALGDAGRREALLSFDRASQPVVILDRSGYAIYSNSIALSVLGQAKGVELKFGRFLFGNIAMQTEFERLVRLAVAGSYSDIPPVPHVVRVPRNAPGTPFAMSIIPLSSTADRAVLPDGAGCMVLIYDFDAPIELPLDRITWHYRLTPAEARVCEALYRVGSVDAVAERLTLTRNTVRSHLKSIYAKFGVATQGQLMQRLANSTRFSAAIASVGREQAS